MPGTIAILAPPISDFEMLRSLFHPFSSANLKSNHLRPSLFLAPIAFVLLAACGGASANSLATVVPGSQAEALAFAPIPPAPTASTAVPTPAPVPPIPAARDPVPVLARDVAPPKVVALAAVVMDENSAGVLYDRDAHTPLPPASLTKIATAVEAIEKGGDLDAMVDTDVDSRTMRGSTIMGLEPGDRFSLRDLLYGLMLPSGNDAALAIGRYIAGSDAAFVANLNALLLRLGLSEAHFTNPHGLGGGTNHVISAYDLALLSRYAMTIPTFREIVSTEEWEAKGSRTLGLENVDSFLSGYAGADGVKTGYTRGAGRTLVASATRNGHRLYVVILNSADRDGDAVRLMNWAFANFRWPDAVQ